MERFIALPVLLVNTVPRIVLIGLLAALFKLYVFLPVTVIFAILCVFSLQDIAKEPKKTLLAILTSLLAPVLVVDDYSYFYLKNSLMGNVLFIITTWLTYFSVSNDILSTIGIKTILECFFSNSEMIRFTMQCYFANGTFFNCTEGKTGTLDTVSVCPNEYDKWHYLWGISWIISLFLLMGLFSILSIYVWFLKPIKRMRMIKKLTCSKIILWEETDMDWLPYLNDLLDGGNFLELNDKAKDEIGVPLLDLFVESKHHDLVKVFKTL